ncbi:ras suppressor protein 1-like [Dermatophagoides pteronyssinus]|uniref:Ras suppressor protein 1-like n=2 Tax=Dermatophagoides pteronyssinus TaxID=6956 RepID=A0A6P6Y9E8_DERPT|nr:ras suppressor protein 1-like [Dermatophagoides pteronyssinus]KAH9423501.1 Ras suppressor protein 1 [Dermatophagoides pteronyssinus]
MTLGKSCLHPCHGNSNRNKNDKIIVKRIDDTHEELHMPDKGIESLHKMPYIFDLVNLRSITLSHNKIRVLSPEIDKLYNLESLNLFNNYISELPITICNLEKLKCLNIGMNNLHTIPNGIERLQQLEILDLSYNFLTEHSFSTEFFTLENLRALYLSDNDMEILSGEIGNLKNLQILAIRDNHLISIPEELILLQRLRELLIQNNRIKMLPPELGNMDFNSPRCQIRMEGNPFEPDLSDQLQLGVSHVLDYIRSDIYRSRYSRYTMNPGSPPPKNEERYQRKLLRLKGK